MKIKKDLYLILDVSGSFINNKRNLLAAKILNDFYANKKDEYDNIYYYHNTTIAKKVNSEIKFLNPEKKSGGSYFSTGLRAAYINYISADIIDKADFVMINDGENWAEDNPRLLNLIKKITSDGDCAINYFILNDPNYVLNHRFPRYHNFETLIANINDDITFDMFKKTFDFKKDYYIYQVEHKLNGKLYNFKSNAKLLKDDIVICNTSQGMTYGKVIKVIKKKMNSSDYEQLKSCHKIGLLTSNP